MQWVPTKSHLSACLTWMLGVKMEREERRYRAGKNEAFIWPVPHEHRSDAFASWSTIHDVSFHWFSKELAVQMPDCCEVSSVYRCAWWSTCPLFLTINGESKKGGGDVKKE